MNLIGEDEYKEMEKKSSNKTSIIIIVAIVITMLICMGIVYAIYYIQSKQFVFTVDGMAQTNYSQDLFVFEDGKAYISIEGLANVDAMGYKYFKGEYKQYEENKESCYVQESINQFEAASYVNGSNKIYKNMPDKTTEYEYFTIDEPVKQINGKLYTTIAGAKLGFNAEIVYNEDKNRVDILTLTNIARKVYGDDVVKDSNYDVDTFNNFKALLYGMKLVTDESSKKIGVYSLEDNVIIGMKYTDIEFMEATSEFKVTTDENKEGIVSSDGVTKIKPEYDSIINIDKDLKLYLVLNNKKYGVITDTNSIVIHTEYDTIGIDATQFTTNNIKNSYLIYNKCIPVQKDKKWGLFDLKGRNIIPVEYDTLGCTSSGVKDKTTNNLLIISKGSIEGIVVGKDKKYGVYSSDGKVLFPIVLDSLYSTTSSGIDEYYMMFNGITYNALEQINKYVSNNSSSSTQENNNIEQNTQEETVQEETQPEEQSEETQPEEQEEV